MRNDILAGIDDPKRLERLYREDKAAFKREFNALYPEIKDNRITEFWNERLNHEHEGISWGSNNELAFVIIASLAAGTIAKAPEYLPVTWDFFYPRNIGFIVFPFLTAYFAWKNALRPVHIAIVAVAIVTALIFMNALPGYAIPGPPVSDTLVLSCIHLPLFLWAVLGFAFVGGECAGLGRRIDFLRFNGDLVVMTTLIVITGALLTGMTFALFSLIDVNIGSYLEYVAVYGLAASPIVGTYVVRKNPQLVNKVSPVIARIFSPLVLVTLAVYLAAMVHSGKDPYNDREFLLTFNLLLIGVMAIILFSIAETSRTATGRTGTLVLLLLAVLTIIVNGVALMAIVFRISEWGITPNRLAVLGGNVLILTNLLIVTYRLFGVVRQGAGIDGVERSIARSLPIYSLWTAIVVFVFPFVFGFK